jgi:hypothetical protein
MPQGITCEPVDNSIPLYAINFTIIGRAQGGGGGGGGAWEEVVCVVSAESCQKKMYEGVSINFRTGRLERELQMVQLSATRCGCIVFCESV